MRTKQKKEIRTTQTDQPIDRQPLDQFKEPLRSKIGFRAATLFLDKQAKLSTRVVADMIREEFKKEIKESEVEFNFTDVYASVRVVVERGLILWNPPINQKMGDDLRERYRLQKGEDKDTVRVVDVSPDSPDSVSEAAANLAHHLIKERFKANGGKPVVLGLGPGNSTLSFSRRLGELLRDERSGLKLKLVGISSGCPPTQPNLAPVSFFNLFPARVIAGSIALLAGPLVEQENHRNRLETVVGLKEAYAIHETIDIVITSMGDFHDAHDGLADLLKNQESQCEKNDWVGSVQYRGYSEKGPITGDQEDFRVVTLFELDDLKHMATHGAKSVILIARPCSACSPPATKARAMGPLLTNPKLRVFSHLVIDSESARELLTP